VKRDLKMGRKDAVEGCVAAFRAKAEDLRQFGAEEQARTLEWAASQVELALRDASQELLTLEQAAKESGFHAESLGRMVREGKIPDTRPPGSRGQVLIRRADLPIKAKRPHNHGTTDVVELASRLGIRRG
jgi:hypothetical protein